MLAPLKEDDGHRLTVMASDITNSCEVRLPDDLATERYGRLGIEFFPISAAVRMSISVPFFFTPYKLYNSLIVDGAFASNLPIEIFDKENVDEMRWPTMGINLTSDPTPGHTPDDLFHFGLAIFDTMRYGQSKMSFMNYPTRISRIIDASTQEVKTLDFNISREQKERLFVNGATAVLKTLRGDENRGLRKIWNFEVYKKLRKRWSFPKGGSYDI
jgi:NTE family protein